MYRMLADEIKWALDDVRFVSISLVFFAPVFSDDFFSSFLSFYSFGLLPEQKPRYQNEPYTFSHLIFISRTYRLSPEEEEESASSSASQSTSHPAKRQKGSNTQSARALGVAADGVYPFHPEDEYIQKVFPPPSFLYTPQLTHPQLASHTHDYPLHPTQQNTPQPPAPREKDAFGLDTRGRMMLLPAERFLEVVSGLSEVYGVDADGVGK
jgi:protein BCP1